MGTILDYLDWRGDVPLSASPFNEVDNLILAQLAYPDYSEIVPETAEAVPLAAVRDAFFRKHSREALLADSSFISKAGLLLDRLITGDRFGTMRLCSYLCEFDPDKTKQVSAVTFLLEDGTAYVSFRGTDDSIAGWKEDFVLSYLPETEGQKRAAAYLNQVAAALSLPLRVGGHSKGANFAVYASALCSAQDRILAVYTNDGPGFREEFIQSEGYRRILPRIVSIIPGTSVVGMLLHSSAEHHVVESTASGILQHDGFTWVVQRDHFVDAECSKAGKIVDQTFDSWINGMDDETRRFFTETFFSVFESTGKETFQDIRTQKLKSAEAMLAYIRSLPREDQFHMIRLLRQLIQSGRDAALSQLPEYLPKKDDRSGL